MLCFFLILFLRSGNTVVLLYHVNKVRGEGVGLTNHSCCQSLCRDSCMMLWFVTQLQKPFQHNTGNNHAVFTSLNYPIKKTMLFFYRWFSKNSTHEKSERNSLNVVAMWDHPLNVNKGWERVINFMQKQCILLYRQHFCKEREYLRLKRQKYVVYRFLPEYFTYIGTLPFQVKHCKRYN